MATDGEDAWIAEAVERQDRDRAIAAMLCPAPRRAEVMTVLAFNGEIARVRDSVSEPTLGHIRLQWWRDALARAESPEAAASPLLHALTLLHDWAEIRPYLLQLLDARAADLDDPPFPDAAAAEAYAAATTAPLAAAMAIAAGFPDLAADVALRDAACGHGLVGILRATPAMRQRGRRLWEADLGDREARAALGRAVAERAEARLASSSAAVHAWPRAAYGLVAPARLARQHLIRLRRAGYDVFDPVFAAPSRVTIGFLSGWILRRI